MLARRLEATEGRGNAAFVEAMAARDPNSGAIWKSIGGTLAMFAGVGSPLTQTFGLGIHAPLTTADLDAIERFFQTRGSRVFHEVCPLGGVEVSALLVARGYKPAEMSSVLFRPLEGGAPEPAAQANLRVRRVDRTEGDLYARIAGQGWSESPEVRPFIEGFAHISVARATCFIAELEGTPIATAALFMHEGVALLAGASTVPGGRRHGAQSALLDTRLRSAASSGCDLAMMCAAPGTASQRNAERNGFHVAYTRTKWEL